MASTGARILAISVDQAIYIKTAHLTPGHERCGLFDQPIDRFDFTEHLAIGATMIVPAFTKYPGALVVCRPGCGNALFTSLPC